MDKQLMLDGMGHMKEIFNRLGIRRMPTWDEVETYIKWNTEWNISHEAITYACKYTTSGSPTVSYLDGILKNLKKDSGEVTSVEDLVQLDQIRDEYKQLCQFFGKTRITNEVLSAFKILRQEYPLDLIILAAKESGTKAMDFQKIRYRLEAWKKKGLTTAEDVSGYLEGYRKRASLIEQIYDVLGQKPLQTRRNHALVSIWKLIGFSDEVILYTAGCAAQTDVPFVYMDAILQSAEQKGLWTVDAIRLDSIEHARIMKEIRERCQAEKKRSLHNEAAVENVPDSFNDKEMDRLMEDHLLAHPELKGKAD